jgi:hypothetical protein
MWHVWKTGEVHTWFWCGGLRERSHLEDLDIDERLILKWTIKNWDGGMDWIDLVQDRQVAGSCECGNEPSDTIKCGEFLY